MPKRKAEEKKSDPSKEAKTEAEPEAKKKASPAKKWCWTLNNYTEAHIVQIKEKLKDARYVFQEEIGEEGTPHLQGWVEFKEKRRPVKHVGIKQIHWECQKAKNDVDAIQYAFKKESRKPGGRVWCNFKLPRVPRDPFAIRHLAQPKWWQTLILELVKTEPDMACRIVYWVWRHEGRIGKSLLLKHLVMKYDALIVGGRSHDIKFGVMKRVEATGRLPILVINNCRSEEEVSYDAIEAVKDGCLFSSKYECAPVVFDPPHVIVFSNRPPKKEELSEDRWVVIHAIDE